MTTTIELPWPGAELSPNARDRWDTSEIIVLREWYAARTNAAIELDHLALTLGRSRSAVAIKASRLGLTDQQRDSVPKIDGRYLWRLLKYPDGETRRAAASVRMRSWIREHGHPRGALGMHHTSSTRELLAKITREMNKKRTPLEKELIRLKSNAAKIARYGTAGPAIRGEQMYSRARGGKRSDLDNRYFRSGWEANYARYLRWLLSKGQITAWEYEPRTFIFEGVTRGVLTYTPDFLVTEIGGSQCWHEVKGWMDARSKAKLKRMAQFFPSENVVVIGPDEYRALAKWAPLIGGWE